MDKTNGFTGQKQYWSSYVLWSFPSLRGNAGEQFHVVVWIVLQIGVNVGFHIAWCNRINIDIVVGPFIGQRPGEIGDGALGSIGQFRHPFSPI